jgi:general stress protein 26
MVLPAAAGEESAKLDERERLIEAAREIVAASRFCALVTIGADGTPHVRMMDAFDPDADMVVWMATNALSRKVEDLRHNPRVAVYYSDPEAPGYVTIAGSARLIDDPAETRNHWKDGWSAFYGEDRSNFILIEIRPESIEILNLRAGVASELATWKAPELQFGEGKAPPQE